MILRYSELKKEVTNLPTFKSWFRNSKIVDSSGQPLIVYHGTANKLKFTEFNSWRPNFFTADKKYAEVYTYKGGGKGRAYSVYLSIQNPFDTRDEEARQIYNEEFIPFWKEKYPSLVKGKPFDTLKKGEGAPFTWADELFSFLRGRNRRTGEVYDGIFVDEGSTPEIAGSLEKIAIVPMYNTQIKSATNNEGSFDPNSGDITK